MDPKLAVEACIALRALARANTKIDAYSFISEIAAAHYGSSFAAFLAAAVAHVERAQRVAERFTNWHEQANGSAASHEARSDRDATAPAAQVPRRVDRR